MKSRKGQVAIETAAALIAVFIFLLGILQIFVWINSVFVRRQIRYEQTRLAGPGAPGYDFKPYRLDIFGTREE